MSVLWEWNHIPILHIINAFLHHAVQYGQAVLTIIAQKNSRTGVSIFSSNIQWNIQTNNPCQVEFINLYHFE